MKSPLIYSVLLGIVLIFLSSCIDNSSDVMPTELVTAETAIGDVKQFCLNGPNPNYVSSTSPFFTKKLQNYLTTPCIDGPYLELKNTSSSWSRVNDSIQVVVNGTANVDNTPELNDDNSIAQLQILHVKNNQILRSSDIAIAHNDVSDANANVSHQQTWTFPESEYSNLVGSKIIIQALGWGCFGTPSTDWVFPTGVGYAYTLHVARDQTFNFNLPASTVLDPTTPTNLILINNPSHSSPELSWNASSYATHYNIYRNTFGYMELIGTTSSTSYIDYSVITKNPTHPTQWFNYGVKAENNNGESSLSNIVAIEGHTYY